VSLRGFFDEFSRTPQFLELASEYGYYKTYDPKKFDVTMVTTDAVCVCDGQRIDLCEK
jgi:hypothetical protein